MAEEIQQQAQGVQPVAAPAAVAQPAPAPEAAPAVQQPAAPQGFGGQPVQNGFAQPQPVQQPVAQPVQQPVVTDNARTQEQFEKLTETNQRLAQQYEIMQRELTALQNRQKANEPFTPAQTPVTPVTPPANSQHGQQSAMPKLEDYIEVDPQGNRYVNEQKFNAAVSEIYQKASRAEEVVTNYVRQTEQREVERQEREAYTNYPQLNPRGAAFDSRFSQQTRAIIYDSMVNPQDYNGRPLTFKEAADFINTGVAPSQAAAPVVAATPTPTANVENQVQKEQAAFQAQNVPQQVTTNIDSDKAYERLVTGTRTGSDEALALRLKNSPHRIEEVERL